MDRVMQYNNLVVRVIRAQGLQLKNHKNLDVYVSLTTSGKHLSYKSKVQTTTVTTTDGSIHWDESCEFQLNEMENELQVNVNYKGKIKTENLGSTKFDLSILPQFQPPKAFKLTKKGNDDKDRGVLFLGFEFSNKIATSVSNFSINTIGGGLKEKKLDYLKRKMHLGKKKNKDAQSLASVSLSRRSSFSSITSALAFNSPSPNRMNRNGSFNALETSADFTLDGNDYHLSAPPQKPELSRQSSINSLRSDIAQNAAKGRLTKVKEKAEKWLKPGGRKNSVDRLDAPVNGATESSTMKPSLQVDQPVMFRNSFHGPTTKDQHGVQQSSRPTSIASSSGFASLGSNNASALNEQTNPAYLLKVIEHLRKELHQKEAKMRDMQEYLDRLLSRVIETNPEILQVANRRY